MATTVTWFFLKVKKNTYTKQEGIRGVFKHTQYVYYTYIRIDECTL